jgi:hypothetical protein
MPKEEAVKKQCNNALTPDAYNHYRYVTHHAFHAAALTNAPVITVHQDALGTIVNELKLISMVIILDVAEAI